MDSQSPLDQETQKASDPHIYKPDEGEDDEDEIDRRIRRADERLRRLTIVGAPKVNNDFLCEDTLTVEGGYDTGYAVNYVDCGAAAGGGGGGEPPTGACCFDDGTCSVETIGQCALDGGTYQGDDTDCDPNPCPQPTGACCVDSDCTIETEEDCTGVYQGDGTVCDPNPCMVECACGFAAFDGSGRRFLNYELVISGAYTVSGGGTTFAQHVSHTIQKHYDPSTCELITDLDIASSDNSQIPPSVGGDCGPEGDEGCWTVLTTICGYICNECPNYSDSTTTTATTSEFSASISGNPSPCDSADGTYTSTITLSNECIPI